MFGHRGVSHGKKVLHPQCCSGYEGVDMTNITMHKFRKSWLKDFLRGGGWTITENTFICSKHFHDSDFVTSRADTNKRESEKRVNR